jgi:hypothetical protein
MVRTTFRRTLVLLLLAAIFAAPAARAAGPFSGAPGRAELPRALNLAGQLWHWLASLWSEEGCHLDPNGRCIAKPGAGDAATTQSDSGCHLDPDGRCVG